MIKKEKPMLSVTAIIQGSQAAQQQWGRSLGGGGGISGVGFGNHHMALGYPYANGLSLEQNILAGPLGGRPQSPLEIKPDASTLDQFSPQGGGGAGGGPNSPNSFALNQVGLLSPSPGVGGGGGGARSGAGGQGSPYPPNHPLSGSKHLCSICGDRASGKHYGVYSCEGCKGFFKRTVRKDLIYACREEKNCIIDKRQRNRCQYCRYQKCLTMGMKREAVQEERQRTKEKDTSEVESTSSIHLDMSLERIVDAEHRIDLRPIENINSRQACNGHIVRLLDWAKFLPSFTSLNSQDQVMLLKCCWNELHIISLAYRWAETDDEIGIAQFMDPSLSPDDMEIIHRSVLDFVTKLREIRLDITEFACLRAIILFNPELRGLICKDEVNVVREGIYEMLEEYIRSKPIPDAGRFAKLLLRLPVLRSIGLKCKSTLIFYTKMGNRMPIETFLNETLDTMRNSCNCISACTCTSTLRRV